MRALLRGVLGMVLVAIPAMGQQAPAPAQTGGPRGLDATLRSQISHLAGSLGLSHVPPADSFAVGGRTIAPGTTVAGDVAVANGPLTVRGRVAGNAIALGGDVIVESGGTIVGDAIAIGGHVRLAGGVVMGEMRSLSNVPSANAVPAAEAEAPESPITTWAAMKLALAWFAVLLVIGIGVMIFAEPNLDGVVLVLQRRLAGAFWTGVLAELALVPALLLLVVALAISLIGILLIPFAIVAYVVAAAGLIALGFLAAARFTGRGLSGSGFDPSSRSDRLRALLLGLSAYLGVWLVVAVLTGVPGVQPVLRAAAAAITWVALTAGLGATVLSRAGTQHERARSAQLPPSPSELAGWQTPTPVTGVAAARRPLAGSKESP